MIEARQAYQVPLAVCINGHAEPIGPSFLKWQFKHPICQHWVWINANYCGKCGIRIANEIKEQWLNWSEASSAE